MPDEIQKLNQPAAPKSELTNVLETLHTTSVEYISQYLLGSLGDNMSISAIKEALTKVEASLNELKDSGNKSLILTLEEVKSNFEKIVAGFKGLQNKQPITEVPTTGKK